MEIKGENYKVYYNDQTATFCFEGNLRLNGAEYDPIAAMLNDLLKSKPPQLTLDLTQLEFLNSSGINVIAKFTIAARNAGDVGLRVRGSLKIPWQSKSLPNLKKLYPSLELVIA